jgi:PAS domain-containing protein
MTASEEQRMREVAQRLGEAEATIQALLSGQIDAVVDPAHMTPVLLAKAQEALRTSEERYRLIVETANEGVWLIDAENKTVFMNRRMDQLSSHDDKRSYAQQNFIVSRRASGHWRRI